jgi:pilus assembly protein CpaB
MEGTMGRRTVLLVAALVVAALGTTMVFLYVNGVNDRALSKQEPVKVLVAKNLIPAGTSVEQASADSSFELKTISRGDAIPNVLGSTTPLNGMVATAPIYPGEQIVPQKFGDAASTVAIAPGKLAISIPLSDPAQVAGFVTPNQKVALFVNAASRDGGQVSLLLPEVKVLAIGNQTATTGTDTKTGGTTSLTLEVDQVQYQKVLYAQTHGQIRLGLLGQDTASKLTQQPTTSQNYLN